MSYIRYRPTEDPGTDHLIGLRVWLIESDVAQAGWQPICEIKKPENIMNR